MGELKTHQNNRPVFAALILAGGKSRRMNFPKPWLPINRNSTFLEAIVSNYQEAGITDIVAVINFTFCTGEWSSFLLQAEKNIKVVINTESHRGRMHSIRKGLEKIKAADYIYVHSVDNPFVGADLISRLSKNICPNGTTIPQYKQRHGHPVLISKEVRRYILKSHNDELTLKEVLGKHKKKYIAVSTNKIEVNINTPQQYRQAIYGLDK
jgi:molybdenum cofactor cytidylyltransferase